MTDDETAQSTLEEARGAHRTSRDILGLMLEPADDPIEVILATLRQIATQQQAMMRRLESIEHKLEGREAGSRGSSRPRVSGSASAAAHSSSTSTPPSA